MVNVQKQIPVEGEQQPGNMFDSSITATNLGSYFPIEMECRTSQIA